MLPEEHQISIVAEYIESTDKEFTKNLRKAVEHEPLHPSIIYEGKSLFWIGTTFLVLLMAFIGFFAQGAGRNLIIGLGSLGLIYWLMLYSWVFQKSNHVLGFYLQKNKSKHQKFVRPYLKALEAAVKELYESKSEEDLNPSLQKIKAAIEKIDPSKSAQAYATQLKSNDWSERVTAKLALTRYGGEAIEQFQDIDKLGKNYDENEITWLVKNFAHGTRQKFLSNISNFICAKCLCRFGTFSLKNFLSQSIYISYYGCRVCKQSREYISCKGDINAILNKNMDALYLIANEELSVNWLLHRKIFDFDQVEIINATDKDVEQFCIQVGNDTDEIRQPKYKQMKCLVKCTLDTNTIRILENTFGEVKNG